MKYMKNQKLQNSPYPVKKEKLQNFGLNPIKNLKRFFFRKETQGFVVFDSFHTNVFFVNNTSKEILSLIDSGLSKEEIKKYISNKYKITQKKALQGINKLWRALK